MLNIMDKVLEGKLGKGFEGLVDRREQINYVNIFIFLVC